MSPSPCHRQYEKRNNALKFFAAFAFSGAVLPVPAYASEPQTDLVFFSMWSALIEPQAESVIGHASELAKNNKQLEVTVTGYADTTGSEAANKLLSQLRAQVVADKLVTDGVSRERIVQKAEGEVPAIGSKQESRRVSITLDEQ